jgi:hypothetical protein
MNSNTSNWNIHLQSYKIKIENKRKMKNLNDCFYKKNQEIVIELINFISSYISLSTEYFVTFIILI